MISTVSSSTSRSGSAATWWYDSGESKTRARPRCLSRCGEAADCLMTAPSGARLPRSTAVPVPAGWTGWCRGMRTAGVQQAPERAQDGGEAAGVAEVLHQVLAARLEVHQRGHVPDEGVEVVELER